MLEINQLTRLHLGVKQENLSRTIQIDMSAWAKTYPNATVQILHKREGDETKALTGATYDSETKILSWTPTNYDTYYEGYGIAEIRMVEGQVVKKTKDLIVTAVCPSVIDGSGAVVASDYQAFLDSVISNKQAAVAAQLDAEDSAEDAEAWAKGTRDGEAVEDTDPAYHNNAKYYADAAAQDAEDAADAKDAAEDAQEAAETAQLAAEAAQGAAELAQGAAESAESGAVSAKTDAEAAAGSLRSAGAVANTLQPGSQATAEIQDIDGAKRFVFGIPRGADGAGSVSGAKMNGELLVIDQDGILQMGTVVTDKSDKADKVSSATSGNFAGLDANGNLTDSGKKASDFLTEHQDISGKADKVTGATTGNFAGLDANGNLTDSGSKASDFLTEHQDISGKVDKSDFYATEMKMSSSDQTSVSSAISTLNSNMAKKDFDMFYSYQIRDIDNALLVDLSNIQGDNNRAGLIRGTTTNKPSDCSFGLRQVYAFTSTQLFVLIYGVGTDAKFHIWCNFYNVSSWEGWKKVAFT